MFSKQSYEVMETANPEALEDDDEDSINNVIQEDEGAEHLLENFLVIRDWV
jgi:hypothetical protein